MDDCIYSIADESEIIKLIDSRIREENLMRCMEEAGEWIRAISKLYRHDVVNSAKWRKSRDDLIEETADLLISISMACHLFLIKDQEIRREISHKMKRNIRRAEEKQNS